MAGSPWRRRLYFLGTGNNERGMAYGNGHVYLVTARAEVLLYLDQNTGAEPWLS